MIVRYDKDLKEQTFLERRSVLCRQAGVMEPREAGEDGEMALGTIEEPILAFDSVGLGQLENGRLIATLFHQQALTLTTAYDGTRNQWFKFPNTWPPAIDTLVHLKGQRESEALGEAREVLDIGCGTGMAGFYAANRNPNIETLDFSDIEQNCTRSVEDNMANGAINRGVGLIGVPSAFIADGFDQINLKNRRYDVIIASAVPATPVYDGLQRAINPLFEGTDFLEKLIREAPEHLNEGGRLILSHSSVGDKAFKTFAGRYGAKTERTLAEREVPFRTEFLGDQKWVDFLVKEGGMRAKEKRGYPYWHTQRVKEISYA